MRSKIHKAVIYAISLLFVIIFWVCIRQQLDSSSSQSGGKYDVRMSTTGVITMLGNEVKIRIDDNAGRLPGEEVQIEFSKVITNPKTIIKAFEVGQKVRIKYFYNGYDEKNKVITVEEITSYEQ